MTRNEAKVKARETIAFEWLQEMIGTEWTATQTENEFERYDATITNGERVIYVENKIRDYDVEKYPEGAVIDADKVDYLSTLGDAVVISYFPENDKIFVHDVKQRDKWERVYSRNVRKDNFRRGNKTEKWIYILPTDEGHERSRIHITDYKEKYEKKMKEYGFGEESV